MIVTKITSEARAPHLISSNIDDYPVFKLDTNDKCFYIQAAAKCRNCGRTFYFDKAIVASSMSSAIELFTKNNRITLHRCNPDNLCFYGCGDITSVKIHEVY